MKVSKLTLIAMQYLLTYCNEYIFLPIATLVFLSLTLLLFLVLGHTMIKVWQDESIKSKKEAHRQGLSTGVKNPSGKGKRLIILHIGKLSVMYIVG